MSRFVSLNHPGVQQWLENELSINFIPPFTTFGFFRGGDLMGAVIFHMWTECDVEMGARLLPGAITRKDMHELSRYVFEAENKRRVTITTPKKNIQAQRSAQRLGFTFECVRVDYYPDDDGVSFCLLKKDCRWL